MRQKLLSGIRDPERFEKLRVYLRAFDDPQLEAADYEEAAQMNNRCRSARSTNLECCVAARLGSLDGYLPAYGENVIGWAAIMPLPSFTVMN